MALFIDPPRWPAHGTVFSHLISDASLDELHAFAARIGIHRRAFDEDHYDIPIELYDQAIKTGAVPVSGVELVRRLRRSGLRIPARERPEKILPLLLRKWEETWSENVTLGEELLQRWSEPHRRYHTAVHLLECLDAIDFLSEKELGQSPPREVRLAVWFHDAVYEGVAGDDELNSAALARETIGGELGEEVARLVLLTRNHQTSPGDVYGELVTDADLAILAASGPRYQRYLHQVREEYSHASAEEWRAGRLAVLRSFLDRPNLYKSRAARQRWQGRAKANLGWESDLLAHGSLKR